MSASYIQEAMGLAANEVEVRKEPTGESLVEWKNITHSDRHSDRKTYIQTDRKTDTSMHVECSVFHVRVPWCG
jgi:hypothetical protein